MSQTTLFNTELVKLAASFNRSTNLELDYKSGEKLSDIFITPKFSSGMSEILSAINTENSNQRVRVLSGSPGLGKSTFALLMSSIVSKKNPRIIKKIVESSEDLALLNIYNEFQKSKSTKLLPVFLNGYIGNIEDAFIEKLKDAFTFIELDGELNKILQKSSKKYWAIVDKWSKDYPEIYESYLSEVSIECDSVEDFQKSLKKGLVSAREIFERIYSKVTGGSSLDAKVNNDVVSVFKEAISLLNANGFNGIFVVYDEFGKYLEKGIHNPSALNIQFLQDFAEFCDRSGHQQCHLTLITHLSVSQYATQLPINIQKEWAKIEGRFHETSFYDRGTSSMDMISHVFEKNIYDGDKNLAKKVEKFNKTFCDSMNGVGLSGIVDRKDSAECLTKCYPMHPITTAFLPLLSQRVAQNERTLYTFLTRDEEFGLKRFLDNGINEKELNFLMPLDLYNYFSTLIAKDVGVGGSYKISLIVDEAFGKIPQDDNVSKQVVALVALSTILKNFNFAPINEKFLHVAFQGVFDESQIKKSVKNLLEKKVFLYNKILKQYELQQGSSIDIDDEINKFREIKLTSKDLVSRVKNYYKTDFISPKRYNYQNSITRFCDTELISVEELKSGRFNNKPDYYKEDGLLYYVVPFDQDELELARRLVRENKDELVIFVLPKSFIECKKDIEELNAINALFGNKEIMNSGPLVKKELDRHKIITLQAIRSVLDPLIGKFNLDAEVFYSKNSMRAGINSYAELLIKVGEIFSSEYKSFVPFNNEMINRHKISGNISLARKQIIDRLLSNPEDKNLGMEGNGPEVTIYRSLASTYGITFNKEEKKYSIKKKTAFYNLLEEYKEILTGYPKGVVVQKLYDTLVAPPYGLRKSLIPLFLSVFDLVLEHPVNHYFDNEYIPRPDGDHYDLMLKHPKNCFVKYTEISKVKSAYLKAVAEVFGDSSDKPNVSTVIESIFKWKKSIPDYTKNSGKLTVEEKKLLIFIESAKEPDRLVFENIPEIFNKDAISNSTKEEDIKYISRELKSIKNKVFNVYPELVSELHGLLLDSLHFLQKNCLNVAPLAYKKGMSLAKEYQDNFAKLPEEIKSYPFNVLTANFLGRLRSFDSSKHSQYFVETIADALTGSNPRYWAEKGKSLFETNLIKCNNEIEMVTELLDSEFSGQSVVAFINKQNGDKEYLRLGVYSDSGEEEIKVQIEKLLSSLNPKSRNNLLISLLKPVESNNQSVAIKNIKGNYIE